jgi:hypothetical protein
MNNEKLRIPNRLEKGQLWKLENGYVYIVELGKRLIHYKLLRQPNQKAVITRLIGMQELLTYLKHTEAFLIGEEPVLTPSLPLPVQGYRVGECQFC